MTSNGIIRKFLILTGAFAAPGLAVDGFRYWNPADTAAAPRTLSATGLYRDMASKALDTNAIRFDLNAPAWTDGFENTRWVLLKDRNRPGGAGSIRFDVNDDYWGYPDSTVFIQQFTVDTIPGDTSSRIFWETRFLMNRKESVDGAGTLSDHWYAFSYKWRRDQSDADLANLTQGDEDVVRIWPAGAGPGALPAYRKWRIPSIYQCDACHKGQPSYDGEINHGRSILGFFTAQLNRPHATVPNTNQLEYFFAKKVLAGVKAPWDSPTTPHWRGLRDSGFTSDRRVSLDVRARSYIAANCSGFHGRRGIGVGAVMGVDLNYDYHTMEARMEFRHRQLSWAWGLDADSVQPTYYPKTDTRHNPGGLNDRPIIPALVVPGYPEKSVLLFRQTQRRTAPYPDPLAFSAVPNQMPPLGTYVADSAAIRLLEEWIRDMDEPAAVGVARKPTARPSGPVVRDGMLMLADEPPGAGRRIRLIGIDGRVAEPRRTGPGAYALPAHLPKGVYLVKADDRVLGRFVF